MVTKAERGMSHVIFFSVNPATLEMPYKEFFEHTCSRVTSEDGNHYFYCLDCTKLDATHPIYLAVTAIIEASGKKLKFLIPHSMVLAIWELEKGESTQEIGFLRS